MRTEEQKTETRLRKKSERKAHRARVFKTHPAAVRYAKAHFKKGKKHQPKTRAKLKLGIQ